MIINIPYDLGDTLFYLYPVLPDRRKRKSMNIEYSIVETTLDAIHIGKSIKGIGNSYARLRSKMLNHQLPPISIDALTTECFYTYTDVVLALNERKKLYNQQNETER